jgi:hypothetical protein
VTFGHDADVGGLEEETDGGSTQREVGFILDGVIAFVSRRLSTLVDPLLYARCYGLIVLDMVSPCSSK